MEGWILTGLILLIALLGVAAGIWYVITHKGCGGDCAHCGKDCRERRADQQKPHSGKTKIS